MQTEKRVECLVEGNEETALVLLDEDEGYLTFIRENGIEWRFNIEDIEEVLRVQRFIRDTINRGREISRKRASIIQPLEEMPHVD